MQKQCEPWGSYVLHNFPFYSMARYKPKVLTKYTYVTKSLQDMQNIPEELKLHPMDCRLWSNEITTR